MKSLTTYCLVLAFIARALGQQEFEDYFSTKVQEYSTGALDAKWDEKLGFSLSAQKDIMKGEIPLQIPCHYVVSAFDYFPYKDDFLLILRDVKEVN